jgi:hypothetical protein
MLSASVPVCRSHPPRRLGAYSRWAPLSENGCEVAATVDYAQHLNHVAGCDPVENDIRRNRDGSHFAGDRRPVVADPALRRRRFEQATPIANALDYRIRSVRAIVRDEAPDRCKVAARGAGEAVARQSVFGDRRFFAKQFAKGVLAVNEVAAIGCFDALLNVGPKPFVERIALRVVHRGCFAERRQESALRLEAVQHNRTLCHRPGGRGFRADAILVGACARSRRGAGNPDRGARASCSGPITSSARPGYIELAPDRFKDFWRD